MKSNKEGAVHNIMSKYIINYVNTEALLGILGYKIFGEDIWEKN